MRVHVCARYLTSHHRLPAVVAFQCAHNMSEFLPSAIEDDLRQRTRQRQLLVDCDGTGRK